MANQRINKIFLNRQLIVYVSLFGLGLLIIANVFLDYVFTQFRNSTFYLSESLLFSGSFWILFFPCFLLLSKLLKKCTGRWLNLTLIIYAIAVHTFAYPGVVWILSETFYYHTFSYWQTFSFGLSAYFIKTSLIYGFSYIAYFMLNKKHEQTEPIKSNEMSKRDFTSSLVVTEVNNKKMILHVNDILYFSANPPYISINCGGKKYLHTETLKSLESKLNPQQFVRIHKSHIINLKKVLYFRSRQNGDYDITLSDSTILRLSRNYAKNFKAAFDDLHHLAT